MREVGGLPANCGWVGRWQGAGSWCGRPAFDHFAPHRGANRSNSPRRPTADRPGRHLNLPTQPQFVRVTDRTNSSTDRAPRHDRTRHGRTARSSRTTAPAAPSHTRSSTNRIPNVCTDRQRGISSATPAGHPAPDQPDAGGRNPRAMTISIPSEGAERQTRPDDDPHTTRSPSSPPSSPGCWKRSSSRRSSGVRADRRASRSSPRAGRRTTSPATRSTCSGGSTTSPSRSPRRRCTRSTTRRRGCTTRS